LSIKFWPSKAILVDGSMHPIDQDTIVKLEIDFDDLDPQELQIMEAKAVRDMVEKIGESVLWGPQQEVSVLRFADWKGEYVRVENGEKW